MGFLAVHSPLGAADPSVEEVIPSSLGEAFVVKANVPWVRTGIELQRGRKYRIEVLESCDYRDSGIPCDADGPRGALGFLFDRAARAPKRLNPFGWTSKQGVTKRLRVLNDGTNEKKRASFLTLIAAIGQDDDQDNVIAIGRCRELTAHKDGSLCLFANDWPGGSGVTGDARYVFTEKSGLRTLPTYGNNKGSLVVVVTAVP